MKTTCITESRISFSDWMITLRNSSDYPEKVIIEIIPMKEADKQKKILSFDFSKKDIHEIGDMLSNFAIGEYSKKGGINEHQD